MSAALALLLAAAARAAEADLASFGAQLGAGLEVAAVLPGSSAADLGLEEGDRLLTLNGQAVASADEAAIAFRRVPARARLSAVVLRGTGVERLEGPAPELEPGVRREDRDLSGPEQSRKASRLEAARAAAAAAMKRASWTVPIARGSSFWVRFPYGLPARPKTGDLVEAEAWTPLADGPEADFLRVPSGSRLWAKVVSTSGPPETRNLRLLFYKVLLAGGGAYRISGAASDVTGDQTLMKVSAGGTLVSSPGVKYGSDLRVKVSLLEPAAIVEPASYYQAGPGLWIKKEGLDYQISYLAPGRSADKAGLQVGDRVHSIGGKSIRNIDFPDALALAYGPPGSRVKIETSRGGVQSKHELERGVLHQGASPARLPLPFAAGARKP